MLNPIKYILLILLILITQFHTNAETIESPLEAISAADESQFPSDYPDLMMPDEYKAGLGSALGQLIFAPTLIAQNLLSTFGSNLQGVVGLINTTHHALQIKPNKTLTSYTTALKEIAAAHTVLITNQTNTFLSHLDTHKEIAQNVSQAIVQAASSWINSTATLAVTNWQSHLSLGQAIINSFLYVRLQSINSTAETRRTIVRGFSTLLEQKMYQQQLFYGDMSILIQNITDASVYDLQVKVNQTQLKFEYLNNKTLVASSAISDVMAALIDTKNSSALSFVAKTTVLLDTIADIVNAPHGLSASVFTNKTGVLLQSMGEVFDILANASITKHPNVATRFNISVNALTDAISGISESISEHKTNVTKSFSNKVENLLFHMSTVHRNVSGDLQLLFKNMTWDLSSKIDDLITVPYHLLRQLAPDLMATKVDFEEAIDLAESGFQKGINIMRQHLEMIEHQAKSAAVRIYYLLNDDYEYFNCAQEQATEFERVFEVRALESIHCASDVLTESLETVFNEVQLIVEVNKVEKDLAIAQFKECHKSEQKRSTCSPNLVADLEELVGSFRLEVTEFMAETVQNENFMNPNICFVVEKQELESFDSIQAKTQQCLTEVK